MTELVREPRRDRFEPISHDLLRDNRLSLAARGLHGYLLSLPDNWIVRANHLHKEFSIGKNQLYRLINELIAAGWLERMPIRNGSGKFMSFRYTIKAMCSVPSISPNQGSGTISPFSTNGKQGRLRKTDTQGRELSEGKGRKVKREVGGGGIVRIETEGEGAC